MTSSPTLHNVARALEIRYGRKPEQDPLLSRTSQITAYSSSQPSWRQLSTQPLGSLDLLSRRVDIGALRSSKSKSHASTKFGTTSVPLEVFTRVRGYLNANAQRTCIRVSSSWKYACTEISLSPKRLERDNTNASWFSLDTTAIVQNTTGDEPNDQTHTRNTSVLMKVAIILGVLLCVLCILYLIFDAMFVPNKSLWLLFIELWILVVGAMLCMTILISRNVPSFVSDQPAKVPWKRVQSYAVLSESC